MTEDELNRGADAAEARFARVTRLLCDVRQVVSVKIDDETELAWLGRSKASERRSARAGYRKWPELRWRLVVRDPDGVDDIDVLSREERIEACFACDRLIARARELGLIRGAA